MAEKIGLQAVLELSSFSHAVSQYNSAISGMSKNTASTASSISSSFVSLGSGILKVGAIAAGVGLAGIAALTGGLLLLGSTALTEFARYERMALSIQSLVARELSQGQLVETQRTVLAGLTKKEADELGGLAEKIKDEELARNTLRARIQEQSEALRQLRNAHGADALDVQTATARLAEMEHQYQASGVEIDNMKNRIIELSGKEGQLVTVMDKVRTGQMSMTEAMKQAGPRAAELLSWISKLAVQSPFTEKGIQDAFQTALAYGFTTEAAQRLTQAEVDFTAATGKGIEQANLIALALGQMQAKGKVSGQELIQLTNAGVGVNKILEDMGFTLDDVSNGLVDSDAFIEAVTKDLEIFGGAGKAQAETFSGLISTLGDLKAIGLREFFTGTFTAIQPYLANFVGMLTSAALETGSIKALGDALGTYVAGGIQNIIAVAGQMMELFGTFQTGGAAGLVAALGITPDAISLFEKFRTMVTQIATAITGPLMAAFTGLSAGGVLDTINQSITFLNEHFEELKGALLGIGAVVAGGVFAALVAGILALLTPINLIIAGAALLGAAWMGNWFGIRDTLTNAWVTIQPILTDLWAWLNTNIPAAVQTITDIWNNTLLPGFTEIYNVISSEVLPALQDLWDTLTSGTGGTQTLSDLWNNTLLPAIKTVGDFVLNTLFPAWVDLEVFLAGALATAITALADYWENWLFPAMGKVQDAIGVMSDLWTGTLEPALVTVGNYINDNIVPLLESLGELFNAVLNKALEASAGLWKNVLLPALTKVGNFLKETLSPVFEKISKSVEDDVSPVLKDLGEVIFPLLQEGLDYVTEAIKTLIGYFDSLTGKVKGFELPAILTPGSPPPMAYAFMDIAKGIDQAALSMKDLDSLMTGLKVTDSGFIDRFIDDLNMGGIGKAAGAGGGQWRNFRNILINEITAGMSGLESGTINFMDKITEVANRFHFPPNLAREFAQAEGLVEHLTGTFSVMFQKLRIENLAASAGIASNFSSIAGSFADMLQSQMDTFKKAGEEIAKSGEANTKLNETLTTQQEKMDQLQADLLELTSATELDTSAIEKKQAAIADLTGEMNKNREAITKNKEEMAKYRQELAKAISTGNTNLNFFATQQEELASDLAMIELLQEFLASGLESLRLYGDETEGMFAGTGLSGLWTQVYAQEELNRLLAEQAERERLITEQKEAQQRLDFLMQQINLMKLLSDRGLNPADILQGITLGLNAGVADLLAATNRVVEAMVNQINEDLQMGSPSRLMIKTFKQVMAGAAIGMERGQSLLSDAVRSIPILNGSIPQPVFSQAGGVGGGSSTYNYNFPMTVNTAATAPAVVRQYEIKRSMYAASS